MLLNLSKSGQNIFVTEITNNLEIEDFIAEFSTIYTINCTQYISELLMVFGY